MSPPPGPHLVLIDAASGAGESSFPVREGITSIGRAEANDIRLSDTAVSRFHCCLERRGHEVRVRDLESHNSTWVGYAEASAERGEPLRDGAVLHIGRLKLLYRDPVASGPAPSAPPPPGARARPGPPARPAARAVERPFSARRPRRARSRRRALETLGYGAAVVLLLVFCAVLVRDAGWLEWWETVRFRQAPSARTDPALLAELEATRAELRLKEDLLGALEERIVSAESSLATYRSGAEAELDALLRDIARLESREMRLQEKSARGAGERIVSAPAGGVSAARAAARGADRELIVRAARAHEMEGDPFLLAGEEAGSRGETVVSGQEGSSRAGRVPPPGKERSPAEIDELVEKLLRVIDNHASPGVSPESLEPALGELARTRGAPGIRGLLVVAHHARDVLSRVDDEIAGLGRVDDGLLAEAQRAGAAAGEGSGYGQRHGLDIERKQRFLELSRTKAALKAEHREVIVALRGAVLAALEDAVDGTTAADLARHFVEEKDATERVAILDALRKVGDPAVVPVLARRLSRLDDPAESREALLEALRDLAGVDAGNRRADWESWWKSREKR